MIFGVYTGGLSGNPTPVGQEGIFDFINGIYSWGGATLAASDVTDKPEWIGASGLSVSASGSAAQLIYSSFKTFLADCHFTGVIEVETITASQTVAFYMQNAGGLYYLEVETWPGSEWAALDNDGVTNRWAEEFSAGLTTGVHKIAFTIAPDHLSISVDGSAAVPDEEPTYLPWEGYPIVQFYLGGTNSGSLAAVNIRSFSIYTAQADGDLPSLSS